MAPNDVDPVALRELATDFARPLHRYLRELPPARAKVYTALNAIAALAGYLIAGTDAEAKIVRAWFDECLDEQIADARAADAASPPITPSTPPS